MCRAFTGQTLNSWSDPVWVTLLVRLTRLTRLRKECGSECVIHYAFTLKRQQLCFFLGVQLRQNIKHEKQGELSKLSIYDIYCVSTQQIRSAYQSLPAQVK
jgi:hypothetical protein